jgi:hypothetical protein
MPLLRFWFLCAVGLRQLPKREKSLLFFFESKEREFKVY